VTKWKERRRTWRGCWVKRYMSKFTDGEKREKEHERYYLKKLPWHKIATSLTYLHPGGGEKDAEWLLGWSRFCSWKLFIHSYDWVRKNWHDSHSCFDQEHILTFDAPLFLTTREL
jgi:hypothetical protein